MKSRFISFLFLLSVLAAKSQEGCGAGFTRDTLYLPAENKTVTGAYLEATLKNKSVVRLYKTDLNKYYLKLVVTENLYFDKADQLEIESDGRSSYEKTTQYQLDKATGYYVFEIFKNYIATLKDDGITAITFGKARTTFTRQDANKIRDISKCFYETIAAKK
jgi:hypothetical protein